MFSFLSKFSPWKIVAGTAAIPVSIYSFQTGKDLLGVSGINKRASDLSTLVRKNGLKVFIFTENDRKTHNYLNKYASPVFDLSSTDYAIIPFDQIDPHALFSHIALNPSARIAIAGDDHFLNKTINLINDISPELLKKDPLSIIPTGKNNRFAKELGYTSPQRTNIASSALSCVLQNGIPIFPIIASNEDTRFIVLDSISTGKLAKYDSCVYSNKFPFLGPLRLPFLHWLARLIPAPTHSIEYNRSGQNETVDSDSFYIKNLPISRQIFVSPGLAQSHSTLDQHQKALSESPFNSLPFSFISSCDHRYNLQLFKASAVFDGNPLPKNINQMHLSKETDPLFFLTRPEMVEYAPLVNFSLELPEFLRREGIKNPCPM